MSPSTTKPQDAFKAPRPGWWTCRICVPNVCERGGWDAYYAHYNRVHGAEVKP